MALCRPDVIYCPTPPAVVEVMLDVAKVGPGDVVYDLGCGDCRIVIAAARRGARGVGFDIDPKRVEEAIANVFRSGLGRLVGVQLTNLFNVELAGASVVTIYLLQHLNDRLISQLNKLKPGSRIVSHDFILTGYQADQAIEMVAEDDTGQSIDCPVHLHTIPLIRVAPGVKP